jgi:hypothetical protein
MSSRALRVVLVVAALGARPAAAAADSLWQAELRAAYGLAMSGAGAEMSTRTTPLTLAAVVTFAFNEEPALAGYGGLVIETLDRNAAGVLFGVQLTPGHSWLRLAAGGVRIVAPYTLWGATASLGACGHVLRRFALCSDVQLTSYVGGSDLADGHVINQAQLVLGVAFDAD